MAKKAAAKQAAKKAPVKTQKTKASVAEFIAAVDDDRVQPAQRRDGALHRTGLPGV